MSRRAAGGVGVAVRVGLASGHMPPPLPGNRDPHPTMSAKTNLQAALAKHMAGDLRGAEALYRDMIRHYPRAPETRHAHGNLGAIHLVEGQLEQAEQSLRAALRLAPNDPGVLGNLGLALRGRGRLDEAVSCHRKALNGAPTSANALNNLGVSLTERGDAEEAIACFERLLGLTPGAPDALFNLGVAFERANRLEEAARRYREVLDEVPGHRGALNNLGNTLGELGAVDEALDCYGRALSLDPGNADAHWNRALTRLLLGDFANGWREFEWRWKAPAMQNQRRRFDRPAWDGGPLIGRTILLHAEQGLGDTLQFLRFVPLVREAGPTRVLLEVQPPLLSLLRASPAVDGVEVIPRAADFPGGSTLPPFDVHAPLMSLPLLLNRGLPAAPAVPMLRASEAATTIWTDRLAAVAPNARIRCGLVWAGRREHANDRRRSLPLAALAPLREVPGVQLVSLQVGPAAADLASWPEASFDASPLLTDFAATAAALASIDLVITVDTAVAHLAGSLGRPTWVLLPFAPDWRWMLGRTDSPWYPTVRLFRQSRVGDWSGPVSEVVRELQRLADGRGAPQSSVNACAIASCNGAST
ncbi:tetratricopeptide repeat protein [Azospirillum brasilense]|uniref:Tetratricopeptide repeat protein n=2 Tax=Azospirillum brasilense TaxID=192 RepID=A0A4D8QGA3_AZOBR|nr:tetratricopeptide repeat protein [Azospirillum brasilense]QEL89672.1 tetratricopeptide repeat protein [Azospirillum brasilense]QEL95974.1 tetratricopeptide repeat protein [Azospirillum brasilense]